jgi:hypothetical protein
MKNCDDYSRIHRLERRTDYSPIENDVPGSENSDSGKKGGSFRQLT